MKKVFLSFFSLLLCGGLYAQSLTFGVVTVVPVEDASDYTFDLYIHQDVGSDGPIYLGNADFVLDFNASAFQNPSLEKVANPNQTAATQTGYCNFTPISSSSMNDLLIQKFYYDNTSTAIENGRLIINLASPTVDGSTFATGIARIDDQTQTHCLGRFVVTGFNGSNANVSWNFNDVIKTRAFSLSEANYRSNEVSLTPGNVAATSIEDLEAMGYLAYPIPAETTFTVETLNELGKRHPVSLTDISGRVVYQGAIEAGEGKVQINVTDLASGVYIARITNPDEETISIQLIKK